MVHEPHPEDSAASGNRPVCVHREFLDGGTAGALLDYALARRELFQPTRVGIKERMRDDPGHRISLATRDLGPFTQTLTDRVAAVVPAMVTSLAMSRVKIARVELEMVAHGDGAFYGRHVDLNPHRATETIRALSGVFYLHAQPRRFSGGQLRLYPSASGTVDRFIDVEPDHNSFVAFPSWLLHEVMPVRCPSGLFQDSRFSVNCWVHVARRPA